MKLKKAFTLIELVVVIAMIGIILTVSVISFGNSRQKARDTKRLSDITQIQNTLELYRRDEGRYPETLTFGSEFVGSSSERIYMLELPENPNPRAENSCPDNNYGYEVADDGQSYQLSFCLSTPSGNLTEGPKCATSQGITNIDCAPCVSTTWSPTPETACSGESFTQTDNCGDERQETGTLTCSVGQSCVAGSCGASQYNLIYTASTGGSIEGSSTQTVGYNESGSAVTAVADSGYRFAGWSDSEISNPRTDNNVTENISVAANFSELDADAVSFINAVATLTTEQQIIIDDLVNSLKSAGLWAKIDILYPLIGGTATTHSYNLKDPASYQITWNGVWTHDASGAVSNGAATSYGATGWNPVALGKNINNSHLSFYNRSGVTETNLNGRGTLGWYPGFCLLSNRQGMGTVSIIGVDSTWASKSTGILSGLITGSRTSSTDNKIYQNNIQQGTSAVSNTGNFTNHDIQIGRVMATAGSVQPFSFVSAGMGLTSTEVSNLYTAVQAYQTSLGR